MQATASTPVSSPALLPYAMAAIPEPYRILGLRLRPFSLGHYLLLQRFGCQFLADDDSQAGRDDLLLGVLICSMRHQEFLNFIEAPNFATEVKAWGRKVKLFNFEAKAELFRRYLKESLQEPDYVSTAPASESGDWAQNLKLTLTLRLSYTDQEALDLPLSKALAEYYKLAESEGLLRLLSAEDLAAGDANAKALAELAALAAKAKGAN